ncbi:MAG: diacylglycerol kinase [archaeon]|nr:diacylglycerol kinase [archaeon]
MASTEEQNSNINNKEVDPIKNTQEEEITKQPKMDQSESVSKEIELNRIDTITTTHQSEEKYLSRLKDILFIFANPLSGNQEGAIFLDLARIYTCDKEFKILDFGSLMKGKYPILTYFFNIIKPEEKSQGMKIIKHFVDSAILDTDIIKIIIAGGDGSVLTTIGELDNYGINLNKCVFGHIPLGTGNDLSNALGFGSRIDIDHNIPSLYSIIEKYYLASPGKVDVWHFELQLDETYGQILMNTKTGKIPMRDKENNNEIIRHYERSFINYVSLGYDARVGYGFDSKRTNSRNCNKCKYCWEGFKKLFCKGTLPVSSFLDSFTVVEDKFDNECEETFFSQEKTSYVDTKGNKIDPEQEINNPNKVKVKFCFRPKNLAEKELINKKCVVMTGTPASIICQNINLYMSGCTNIWSLSGNKHGLEILNSKDNKETEKISKMINAEQKLDDHKLEFFCYDSAFKLASENISHGNATKLYHGKTPVIMKFRDTPVKSKDDSYNRVYIEIDGEYFHIIKPRYLKIDLNRNLCNGSLPFLINKKIGK